MLILFQKVIFKNTHIIYYRLEHGKMLTIHGVLQNFKLKIEDPEIGEGGGGGRGGQNLR